MKRALPDEHDETAESFGPWRWPSPMVDRLGDLKCHRTDPARFGFVVDEPKLNGHGYLHAGALSTIADVVIGHSLASMAVGDVRFVPRRWRSTSSAAGGGAKKRGSTSR